MRRPPKTFASTAELSREEWLAYRRQGIGGSDAASVLGISPFRTGVDLYYDKLGHPIEDSEENWVAMEVGTRLEELVARIFAKKTGLKIFQMKFMFQHPDYPWMLADLDYLVELPDGSTAILECKTTNYNAQGKWEYDGRPIVPEYYEAQGRHYMAVMDLNRVYYCCLYGNNEDEAIIRHMIFEAATRGDGNEGEVITHNVRGITGIPSQISYKGRLVVTGEAFIRPSDFAALQDTLVDSSGQPYKNGRNLAAGSVRLLNSEYCRDRRVTFMPFNVLEGFDELPTKSAKLKELRGLGFQPCKHFISKRRLSVQETESAIQQLRQYAQDNDVPIDGIVATYNDVAYAKTCGRTGHHYKDGLAFKFEDELYETKLIGIEWNPSRTGEIAPVAILHPVVIDGCTVSRASLHNLSFIEGLELMPGNRVLVSKRNQIIPHVEENLERGGFDMDKMVMHYCPCCGAPTRIHETKNTANGVERVTKTLFCDNPDCATRHLRQFVHFAGKKAMDIEGLSEATLEKFIGWGLLHDRLDIYELDAHKDGIVQMDGFGEKSYQNLWDAIQRSRDTTFERYLIAMDIPMIGNTASRALAKQFHSSLDEFESAVVGQFDFTQLPDFGATLHQNIYEWFQQEENWYFWAELRNHVTIAPPPATPEPVASGSPFVGKTIVVTGKVEPYTRDGINAKIESLGAHAGSSVSGKTDYLVCGENAGSKLAKAKELGVTVLTPAQFFQMAGE